MSDWCFNVCKIEFGDGVFMLEFMENYLSEDVDGNKLGNPKNSIWKFSKILPVKTDGNDSIGIDEDTKRINAWGVKWEPKIELYRTSSSLLSLQFKTPGGPPLEMYRHLMSHKEDFGIGHVIAEAIEPRANFGVKFYDGAEYNYSAINKKMAKLFTFIDVYSCLDELEK